MVLQQSCKVTAACRARRLDLAERIRAPPRPGGPARRNPFEAALAEAERLEAAEGPPSALPFTATVLCLGMAGVGKSATINSLLGLPEAAGTGTFAPATRKARGRIHHLRSLLQPSSMRLLDTPMCSAGCAASSALQDGSKSRERPCTHAQVRVVEGSVNGIAVRFIDTPGLQPAASAAAANARILADIRRAHNKHKPDIVLYFDRMDLVRAAAPLVVSAAGLSVASLRGLAYSSQICMLHPFGGEPALLAHKTGGWLAASQCLTCSARRRCAATLATCRC